MVSIHAPVWGATSGRYDCYGTLQFQFTRPCGARRRSLEYDWVNTCFNSRARVGRDPIFMLISCYETRFNSRARVGRDKERRKRNQQKGVSIHAPVWGATCVGTAFNLRHASFNSRARVGRDDGFTSVSAHRLVSIHAPVWGATHISPSRIIISLFQFTRPCGARLFVHTAFHFVLVSIHAPVWGATVFNVYLSGHRLFQFTRPCGARLIRYRIIASPKRFNSRARVGRDNNLVCG